MARGPSPSGNTASAWPARPRSPRSARPETGGATGAKRLPPLPCIREGDGCSATRSVEDPARRRERVRVRVGLRRLVIATSGRAGRAHGPWSPAVSFAPVEDVLAVAARWDCRDDAQGARRRGSALAVSPDLWLQGILSGETRQAHLASLSPHKVSTGGDTPQLSNQQVVDRSYRLVLGFHVQVSRQHDRLPTPRMDPIPPTSSQLPHVLASAGVTPLATAPADLAREEYGETLGRSDALAVNPGSVTLATLRSARSPSRVDGLRHGTGVALRGTVSCGKYSISHPQARTRVPARRECRSSRIAAGSNCHVPRPCRVRSIGIEQGVGGSV